MPDPASAPGRASTVVVITVSSGQLALATTIAGESVAGFARHGTTMAVYLSAARPGQLREELLALATTIAGVSPG